ncbi:hypothetical protein [Helicobacter pylori]|uniref:hypothetical protein n=1 Tax=Helicobacter pylori TaxID=210 RepID=UPI00283A9577|nr:hypothetical protein [Helicobacter pylori]WJI97592.1 hypothetical protein QAP00_03730 [Helicobacter pylori]
MEDSFKTLDKKEAIDVAYLCVKETSSRVEGREKELLSLTKEWNIPTIVIFTNTQEKAGDAFVKEAQKVIKMKSGGLAVLSEPMRESIPLRFHLNVLKSPLKV